jgi:hypothetical protein
MIRIALSVLLTMAAFSNGFGQDTARVEPPPRGCFRTPVPTCRTFWIIEPSYLARLSGGGGPSSTTFDDFSVSLELGALREVSPSIALGGTISANLVNGVAWGIRPRIRYSLGPTAALDLAPGLLVAGVPGPPRFAADVTLMLRNRIGITVQSFVLPATTYLPDGTYSTGERLVLYGGVRLGSKLGLYGAAADVLAFLALVTTFLIACSNDGCD